MHLDCGWMDTRYITKTQLFQCTSMKIILCPVPCCSLLSGESQHRTITLQHCPLCRHRSSLSHTRAGTSDHNTRGFMATKHVIFRLNCSKNPVHNYEKEESEKKCWDILFCQSQSVQMWTKLSFYPKCYLQLSPL